jgi:pimeloyl-ACP methyl ester carboxylesterase
VDLIVAFICLAAAVVLAGFLYQWIGSHRDRRRYAGEGRWIDIGDGHRLFLLEKGSGGPTVLFEAGIAATNLNWCHIQDHVARFTGTLSYDRAGLGWSSPNRTPRTPGVIAAELHTMLERAGIRPPYVLVGHSFGGLVMRRFALDYPDEVASVVLVDPMRCEEWPPLRPDRMAEVNRARKLSGYAIPIARFGLARLAVTSLLCRSGWLSNRIAHASGNGAQHVLRRVTEEVGKMPREVWPIVAAHWASPSYYAGMRNHVLSVPDSVREMIESDPIRDIPVLVLTPEKSTPLDQELLNQIGDNVTQVIAPRSAHWIHLDQPDLVIDSIRTMVEAATPQRVAVTA